MKKSRVLAAIFVVLALAAATVGFIERGPLIAWYRSCTEKGGIKGLFYCPMHPAFTSDRPGNCAICGMSLVKKETADAPAGGQKAGRWRQEDTLLSQSHESPGHLAGPDEG